MNRNFRPFRLQPPIVVPGSVCFCSGLTSFYLVHPVCRECLVNWASPLDCRFATTTSRIEFDNYGLVIHPPLLPTPPHGDAVTVGYEVQTNFDKDLHLAESIHLHAHNPAGLSGGLFGFQLQAAIEKPESRRLVADRWVSHYGIPVS